MQKKNVIKPTKRKIATVFFFVIFLIGIFFINNFLFIKLFQQHLNSNIILIKTAFNIIIFLLYYFVANLTTLTMQGFNFLRINRKKMLSLAIIIWFFSRILFQIPSFLGTFFPYLTYINSLILNSIIFFTMFVFSYISINLSFLLIFDSSFFEEKLKNV